MERVLYTLDYKTVCCATAEDALDSLRIDTFGILITDFQMPEIDGLEPIKEARDISPGILTILMTGLPTLEIEMAAKGQRVNGFFPKPLDWDKLIGFLNSFKWEKNGEAVPKDTMSKIVKGSRTAENKSVGVQYVILLAAENVPKDVPKGDNEMENNKKRFVMAAIVPVFILAGVLFYISTFNATKGPALTEKQSWERNSNETSFDRYARRGTSPHADGDIMRRNDRGMSYAAPPDGPRKNNEEGFMRGKGRGRSLSRGDGDMQDQRARGRGRGRGMGRGWGRGMGRGDGAPSQNRNSDS
jgi:CheY-like chemotaxis protein